MKKAIIITFSFLIFLSCQDSENKQTVINNENQKPSLIGAWELTGFYNYKNNVIIDSFTKSEDFKQVKIYSPTKVMWSKKVPNDTTDWFGYGSYAIDSTKLTEVLDYGSKVMNQVIKEKTKFEYELLLEKDKFTQIELDENGDRIYSEIYERIE